MNVSMLGNDCDELKRAVLKAFYSRREEEQLESNVELFESLVQTTQADRRGELCMKRFNSKVKG